MTDYSDARFNMVEGQVKPNKVTDSALMNAMLNVPRDKFVPKAVRGIAHVDEDVPIGNGRYLMEPMVFGRLVNDANVRPTDIVLDIGCGYGYSTAILARLCSTVVALESDGTMAGKAADILAELGADNAVVLTGDLTAGWPDQGPYDVIFINGAVDHVPQGILDQLADGGRLATVLASAGGRSAGYLYQKFGETVSKIERFDAYTPYLPGFEPKPVFEF